MTKSQYGDREVKASKAVLLELIRLLGEFKDEIVIIGGWVPTFLFPDALEPHVGSLDIDVALNFSKISSDTYQTILEIFRRQGYLQDRDQPFRFFRTIQPKGFVPLRIEVDLMAGEYGGTGKVHRTQKIQDVRARKARGCDLAFKSAITTSLDGDLPDGSKDKVSFKVSGIVPFLVMKGMALYDRMKEKDAYDIFYCVEYYPDGIQKLYSEFKPYIKNKLVIEGLGKIRSKFASVEHTGPRWVADFLELKDKDDRDIQIRRAYEKVTELLDRLKIFPWEEA